MSTVKIDSVHLQLAYIWIAPRGWEAEYDLLGGNRKIPSFLHFYISVENVFHFEKITEKNDYIFDVKFQDRSIPQVFIAIPALPDELGSFLFKKWFLFSQKSSFNLDSASQPREDVHLFLAGSWAIFQYL